MHLQSEDADTSPTLDRLSREAGWSRRTPWLVGVTILGLALALGAVLGLTMSEAGWVSVLVAGLALVLIATVALCLHAGGHAWLAPLPAVAVAAGWAILASSGNLTPVAAWSLAATTIVLAAGAALLAGAALAQPRGDHPTWTHPWGSGGHLVRDTRHPLRGADGVALTDMTPIGVVRIGSETWSGESLSGPLLAGAPVHVVAVRGLRLEVWSEAGIVPGPEGFTNKEASE